MIKPKVLEALNTHLNYEFYSAYSYLGMSAWLESQGLPGCGKWMHVQGQEELLHAHKFYRYILDRDAEVELFAIDKPAQKWKDVHEVFRQSYEHEQQVTERINGLMDVALKHSDHATTNFLQWFVTEQVEEEATLREILDKLKLIGKDGSALLLLDQDLGGRALGAPALDAPAGKGG
jgi:ferritin